jgi:hypothetical protein
MKTLMLACVAATLAAACATPAERAEQSRRRMEDMMATYGPACERLGYKAASDSWRDCILRLDTRDAYERYRMYAWPNNCIGGAGFYPCSMF